MSKGQCPLQPKLDCLYLANLWSFAGALPSKRGSKKGKMGEEKGKRAGERERGGGGNSFAMASIINQIYLVSLVISVHWPARISMAALSLI